MKCNHCNKEIPDGEEAIASNDKDVHESCYARYEIELAADREEARRERVDSWRGAL